MRLDLAKREHEGPEYLALSPLGAVPALVHEATTLTEPAAIALYLADRYATKRLAPPSDSPDRAAYYQWLLFAEATLFPAVMALYGRAPASDPEGTARDTARLAAVLDVVARELDTRDHLAAGHFTAADVAVASILHVAHHLGALADRPRLQAYVQLHAGRPASRRAVS